VVNGDVPLVVCVSADVGVREQVVRRLEDCGAVLICSDLDELRAMLFPTNGSGNGSGSGSVPPPPNAAAGAANGLVTVGDLVVDLPGHLVTWRGRPLPLTRLERELLGRLATPPIGVWTYQRLFDAVWGKAYLGDTSILHSAVKRLRGKLRAAGDELGLETVRGVGYRLAVPN
jgi:DNA-binding response OmpR family regulator